MKNKATYYLAFLFLLIASGLSTYVVTAQTPSPPTSGGTTTTLDCQECHNATYNVWAESPHGQGLTCVQCHDVVRDDFGRAEHNNIGTAVSDCITCHKTSHDATPFNMTDNNIDCADCHSPIEKNHPDQMMPTDRTEDLCGSCHVQALYAWQQSEHGALDISCVSCHRQHGTTMREGDVSQQCAACHGSRVEAFSHSEHGDQGLSCADCHLAPSNGSMSQTLATNHSFVVSVGTCVSCHAELHDGATAVISTTITPNGAGLPPTELLAGMSSTANSNVSTTPTPVTDAGLMTTTLILTLAGFVLMGGVLTSFWSRLGRHTALKGS